VWWESFYQESNSGILSNEMTLPFNEVYKDVHNRKGLCWSVAGTSRPIGRDFEPPRTVKKVEGFAYMTGIYPDLAQMEMPPRGGAAEYNSLVAHIAKLDKKRGDVLITGEYDPNLIMARTARTIKKMATWKIFDDDWSYKATLQRFKEVISGEESLIPKDSCPGFPWACDPSNRKNSDFSHVNYQRLWEIVWARICAILASVGEEKYEMRPLDFVRANLTDPTRMMIKNEPHDLQKVLDRVFRLIWNLSVVDQIVDKMLYKPLDNLMIENWEICTSKSGMPATQAGWFSLAKGVKSVSDMARDSDNSMWDWGVTKDLMYTDVYKRSIMMGMAPEASKNMEEIKQRMRKSEFLTVRMMCLNVEMRARPAIVLSNGIIFEAEQDIGVQSGKSNTSSSNGNMREILEDQVVTNCGYQLADCMGTMGDDFFCSQKGPFNVETYKFEMLRYGSVIKQVNIGKEFFEFCSHRISLKDGSAVYINKEKAIMQFCVTSLVDAHRLEAMLQYVGEDVLEMEEVKRHPEFAEWCILLGL